MLSYIRIRIIIITFLESICGIVISVKILEISGYFLFELLKKKKKNLKGYGGCLYQLEYNKVVTVISTLFCQGLIIRIRLLPAA